MEFSFLLPNNECELTLIINKRCLLQTFRRKTDLWVDLNQILRSAIRVVCHCLWMSDVMWVGLRGECRCRSFDISSGLFGAVERFGGLLECVFLPCLLEEVPALCFRNSSLSRVTFGSGSVLKRIGKEAFRECRELREIEIPASVEEIGEGCFSYSSLSRVTFGSGSVLKRIGHSAFSGCKELREIEIPASVEVVGNPGVVVRRV